MDICTFWYGKKLRIIDRICLSSMVMAGHRVKLFTHEKIENVPPGIEIYDAEPILSLSILFRLDPEFSARSVSSSLRAISIVQFSDFFRVMLMKHRQGFWLDTDVYLVKPIVIDPCSVWFARENRQRIGVSALYLSADNPIITAFESYLQSAAIVPNWLGVKRRYVTPFVLRMSKKPITTNQLGITIFGNDGISRLAKRYGFFDQAQAKATFYYWTARYCERVFDPSFGLEPLNDPNFIGFHVHRKRPTDYRPAPGSFYEWAVKRLPDAKDYLAEMSPHDRSR